MNRRAVVRLMVAVVVATTACDSHETAASAVNRLAAEFRTALEADAANEETSPIETRRRDDGCTCPAASFDGTRSDSPDAAQSAAVGAAERLGFTAIEEVTTDPTDEQASPDGRALRVIEGRKGEADLSVVIDEIDGTTSYSVRVFAG